MRLIKIKFGWRNSEIEHPKQRSYLEHPLKKQQAKNSKYLWQPYKQNT